MKINHLDTKTNRAGGLVGFIGGMIALLPEISRAFFPESNLPFSLPQEDFLIVGGLISILGAVILNRAIAIFLLLFAILSYLLIVIIPFLSFSN
jgi:hypothetical protein